MNLGISAAINPLSMLNRVSIFSPMDFITSSSFPVAVLLSRWIARKRCTVVISSVSLESEIRSGSGGWGIERIGVVPRLVGCTCSAAAGEPRSLSFSFLLCRLLMDDPGSQLAGSIVLEELECSRNLEGDKKKSDDRGRLGSPQ